jgi:hypothetical protein
MRTLLSHTKNTKTVSQADGIREQDTNENVYTKKEKATGHRKNLHSEDLWFVHLTKYYTVDRIKKSEMVVYVAHTRKR